MAETIDTDVVIIGGGASGTYAAVRLRDDYGVRVTVIEEKNQLVSCHPRPDLA
jgi:flavin-dependent dehydrogenase